MSSGVRVTGKDSEDIGVCAGLEVDKDPTMDDAPVDSNRERLTHTFIKVGHFAPSLAIEVELC